MHTLESIDSIVSQLIRRGLPQDYAQRAAAEFADHHRDLVQELQASGSSEPQAISEATRRLGDARTLVNKTVREYQRRHWCGRWPKLAFLVFPIPAMYALWLTALMLMLGLTIMLNKMGIIHLDQSSEGPLSPTQRTIAFGVVSCYILVLPVLMTVAFARMAKRARLGGRWIVISACLIGLCAGSVGFYHGPSFKSAADAVTRTNPTPAYGVDVCPFANAAFWVHPLRSLFRMYTIGVFQPYQTLLPIAIGVILLIRSTRLTPTTEWQTVTNG
ncbi:MAG TPA: hypothetical protein VHU84_15890 [Lacipirellulaceae bacterium]|jgi:hypothetical protein|nr:hypothetical protein [Lacipirellulaceae bacterium]